MIRKILIFSLKYFNLYFIIFNFRIKIYLKNLKLIFKILLKDLFILVLKITLIKKIKYFYMIFLNFKVN